MFLMHLCVDADQCVNEVYQASVCWFVLKGSFASNAVKSIVSLSTAGLCSLIIAYHALEVQVRRHANFTCRDCAENMAEVYGNIML